MVVVPISTDLDPGVRPNDRPALSDLLKHAQNYEEYWS